MKTENYTVVRDRSEERNWSDAGVNGRRVYKILRRVPEVPEPERRRFHSYDMACEAVHILERARSTEPKPTEQPKENTMSNKMRNLAAFVDDDLTTVSVTFSGTARSYTYVISRDLADELETGDQVLVKATGELKVVTVVDVHPESEVDIDANFGYSVVIQKVDYTEYNRIEERLTTGKDELRRQQRAALRQQIKGNLSSFLLEKGDAEGEF